MAPSPPVTPCPMGRSTWGPPQRPPMAQTSEPLIFISHVPPPKPKGSAITPKILPSNLPDRRVQPSSPRQILCRRQPGISPWSSTRICRLSDIQSILVSWRKAGSSKPSWKSTFRSSNSAKAGSAIKCPPGSPYLCPQPSAPCSATPCCSSAPAPTSPPGSNYWNSNSDAPPGLPTSAPWLKSSIASGSIRKLNLIDTDPGS